MDYWAPTSRAYPVNSTAVVSAPLTTLPVFQRKGSVVPLLDLGDARTLVLRTHAESNPQTAKVYDDDGISTRAELLGEYFELRASTVYRPRDVAGVPQKEEGREG